MRRVFFALCKAIDSPISLGAWLRFEHNQLALAEMSINPLDYNDPSLFEADYLVVNYLSKWKGLNTGLDLKEEALRKFTSSETQCFETNKRLEFGRSFIGGLSSDFRTASVLFTARRKIARLLGSFKLSKVNSLYGWGPGATDDIRRRCAFVDLKMCKLPISVTEDAALILGLTIQNDLRWSSLILGVEPSGPYSLVKHAVFSLTEECVIETVPKNAKTDRVIAKEPRGNAFLQKGIGGFFRRRLKSVGIDLDNQGHNQAAAMRAYESGLATLDLKAASDTVAIELVYELFPLEWASMMDTLRSRFARLPNGKTVRLHKFSSMGNGFTFELESVIFWALTSSVCDLNEVEAPLVYGDDIICPSRVSDEVISVLNYCGFVVNDDKSFTSGPFYESCGKHFFRGKEVTPIYQKEVVLTEPSKVRCGNRLMRFASRHCNGSLDKRLFGAWSEVWRHGGRSKSFQIPLGTQGDDGWLLPADYFDARPQDINLGLRCRVIRQRQVSFPANENALLAWSLRRGVKTESPFGGNVTSSPSDEDSDLLLVGQRWVMPTGEFGQSWCE